MGRRDFANISGEGCITCFQIQGVDQALFRFVSVCIFYAVLRKRNCLNVYIYQILSEMDRGYFLSSKRE